jgi:hypothetical protein
MPTMQRREPVEDGYEGKTLELAPQDEPAIGVEPDEMENVLADVDPDDAYGAHVVPGLGCHYRFSSGAVRPRSYHRR